MCAEAGWLAASPDGHVCDDGDSGLLEIKCPFSRKIYPSIPDYYVDQVQGLCAILGYEWADFVVWTPEKMQVQVASSLDEIWIWLNQPRISSSHAPTRATALVRLRVI